MMPNALPGCRFSTSGIPAQKLPNVLDSGPASRLIGVKILGWR
jgi:hypothetical protein